MLVTNELLLDTTTPVAATQNSAALPLLQLALVDATATIAAANPSNKTFISGTLSVQTLTFPTKSSATGGDYIVISDQAGAAWAASLNKSGTDPAPTGAAWAAVASGKKANVDISGVSTAAAVAGAVKAALNALTGFTAVLTLDDSAADGTMTSTAAVRGPAAAPAVHNADDSGAGSITGVSTTAGVTSQVSTANDTATTAAQTYVTGTLVTLTTTGSLPTGLLTSTNYYLIVVDQTTVKFATSQANALAGTAVDITGFGTGTHTITVTATLAGSVKLQKNNEPPTNTPIWFDVTSSSQNFSAAGNLNWALVDVGYSSLRAVVTVTSGTVTVSFRVNAKGV